MFLSKGEAWNIYAENYNLLVEKMVESGIDILLLDEVISSHEKAINNKNKHVAYQSIYQSKVKNTV